MLTFVTIPIFLVVGYFSFGYILKFFIDKPRFSALLCSSLFSLLVYFLGSQGVWRIKPVVWIFTCAAAIAAVTIIRNFLENKNTRRH